MIPLAVATIYCTVEFYSVEFICKPADLMYETRGASPDWIS